MIDCKPLTNSEILWKAILADPWDMFAWSVYCDALIEQGSYHIADYIQTRQIFDSRSRTNQWLSYCLYCKPSVAPAKIAVWCELEWWMKNGPALVKTEPIMWVRITDRRAERNRYRTEYTWFSQSEHHFGRDYIHPEIFHHLEGYKNNHFIASQSLLWRDYRSFRQSRRALNEAALRWARLQT